MSTQQLVHLQEDAPIADFVVTSLEERDLHLDRAIDTAQVLASVDVKLGVLVTRHDFRRFSVALTPEVPYGLIKERDLA
jgi:hypothetical protein